MSSDRSIVVDISPDNTGNIQISIEINTDLHHLEKEGFAGLYDDIFDSVSVAYSDARFQKRQMNQDNIL